jgi:hypothetical protein
MLLQCTNKTATSLALFIIPHKSNFQPENDSLCKILRQNNSQVRSSSHLVGGVFTELKLLMTAKWIYPACYSRELTCVD